MASSGIQFNCNYIGQSDSVTVLLDRVTVTLVSHCAITVTAKKPWFEPFFCRFGFPHWIRKQTHGSGPCIRVRTLHNNWDKLTPSKNVLRSLIELIWQQWLLLTCTNDVRLGVQIKLLDHCRRLTVRLRHSLRAQMGTIWPFCVAELLKSCNLTLGDCSLQVILGDCSVVIKWAACTLTIWPEQAHLVPGSPYELQSSGGRHKAPQWTCRPPSDLPRDRQEEPGWTLHTVGPRKNHGIAGPFRPAVEKLDPAPMKQLHFSSWYWLIPPIWPQAFGSGVNVIRKPTHRNPGSWLATLILMQIEKTDFPK